ARPSPRGNVSAPVYAAIFLSARRAPLVFSFWLSLFSAAAILLPLVWLWISLWRWPAGENARHVPPREYAPSLPVQIRLLALTVTFLRVRLPEPVQLFLVLA